MLTTSRCMLTAPTAADADAVVALHANPTVRAYLGGPVDERQLRAQFTRLLESDPAPLHWAVRLRADATLIGTISIGAHHNGVDRELSYQFLPDWWGQGYASECVQAVLDYAATALRLRRLVAETQTANRASCRLLERTGFQRERIIQRFGAEQAIYVVDPARRAFPNSS